jgi:hypothetical protein
MKHFSLVFLMLMFLSGKAQQDSVVAKKEVEKVKTGWTLGLLPAVAYDSDLGFKYGGLVNFYNFGDGTTYPNYLHSIYLEVNRTTKGSGANQLFFDSEHLFKKRKIRVTSDLSYLTEQALNFYGFNGAEAYYNQSWEDDASDDYISRMFYRMDRRMLRFTTDFQGYIYKDQLRWLVGVAHFTNKIGTVDIDRLNKGKSEDKQLPEAELLYDKYVDWGIIPEKEADGGVNNYLKAGLVYDTRDIEANPNKGMWTEALILAAPEFLLNKENAFGKLVFIHRQYFTLVPQRLTFAYRLGYQGTIWGDAPFYMQSYLFSSYSPSIISEGLGGAKSIRGIQRNRIVGDGFTYGNFELRYKFLRTTFLKQNFYLAVNPFVDAGMVIDPIQVDRTLLPATENPDDYFRQDCDCLHTTYGIGLHAALNENFVLSINYGRTKFKQDGKSGLYIGTNWLF